MKAPRLLIVSALLFVPGIMIAAERFDGTWKTRITCPGKTNNDGYTWGLSSVVENGTLRGSMGNRGLPGWFLLEGKIASDGSAVLLGSGIVNQKQFALGFLGHKGEPYSAEIKAKFRDTEGSGSTNQGLGLPSGPCAVEFVKELVMVDPG